MPSTLRTLVVSTAIGVLLTGTTACAQPPADPEVPPPPPDVLQNQPPNPFERALAPPPPRRLFRTRLASAPDMFGDLFGSSSGSLVAPIGVPTNGVTNGLTGTATFIQTNGNNGTGTFVQNPVLANALTVTINTVPNVNGNPTFTFAIDTGETFYPDAFTADAATLVNVDGNINVAAFLTPITAAIAQIEAAADPTASVQSVVLSSQNAATTTNNLVISGTATSDILFPLIVQTLIASPTNTVFNVPSPGTGGAVVGRLKIAENTATLPRDRVFVGYSYFDNVPLVAGGTDVNRFVPGFEKTFFEGNASIRVRLPMAATLSSDVNLDGRTAEDVGELGNVTLDYKQLFVARDGLFLAAGLGIALPTADDLSVHLLGREFIRAENEGVRLLPFVGGLASVGERSFVQGFLQFDFDTNGNTIHLDSGNGQGLMPIGRVQDTAFLFVDAAFGHWIVDRRDSGSWLRGLVATTELHYNRSLESGDVVGFQNVRVGDFSQNTDLLNGVIGATASLGNSSNLGVAYVVPLGAGADQQFDGELRVTYNKFFGPYAAGRR